MLIYHTDLVEVYASILTHSACCGPAEIACAKTSLLAEAFPDHPHAAIGHQPDGAPVLENTPFPTAVSITHSRRVLAMAIAKKTAADSPAIGIDTETPDRTMQLRRIAPRFLSAAQLSGIRSDLELLKAWTTKEALYKAARIAGWALRDIPLPPHGSDIVALPGNRHTLRLIDIPLPPDWGVMTLALSTSPKKLS